SARQCVRWTMAARLSVPATARRMTSPPSPPSPPSGPPLGTYFSRRKLHMPGPPSPPLTKIVTRSTKAMIAAPLLSFTSRYCSRSDPSPQPPPLPGEGEQNRPAEDVGSRWPVLLPLSPWGRGLGGGVMLPTLPASLADVLGDVPGHGGRGADG